MPTGLVSCHCEGAIVQLGADSVLIQSRLLKREYPASKPGGKHKSPAHVQRRFAAPAHSYLHSEHCHWAATMYMWWQHAYLSNDDMKNAKMAKHTKPHNAFPMHLSGSPPDKPMHLTYTTQRQTSLNVDGAAQAQGNQMPTKWTIPSMTCVHTEQPNIQNATEIQQ